MVALDAGRRGLASRTAFHLTNTRGAESGIGEEVPLEARGAEGGVHAHGAGSNGIRAGSAGSSIILVVTWTAVEASATVDVDVRLAAEDICACYQVLPIRAETTGLDIIETIVEDL